VAQSKYELTIFMYINTSLCKERLLFFLVLVENTFLAVTSFCMRV